jgi:hypothetical protein
VSFQLFGVRISWFKIKNSPISVCVSVCETLLKGNHPVLLCSVLTTMK